MSYKIILNNKHYSDILQELRVRQSVAGLSGIKILTLKLHCKTSAIIDIFTNTDIYWPLGSVLATVNKALYINIVCFSMCNCKIKLLGQFF